MVSHSFTGFGSGIKVHNSLIVIAVTKLTLVNRNATRLVVQFVPQTGVRGYEIRARSPVKGVYTRSCDAQTRMCEIDGLPSGIDYTLWLQTCETAKHFKLCYLRAMEFETIDLFMH